MKIGNLNIGSKLILAPMAEISDAPFRKIAKEFGAGLTFTQMVSADGIVKGNFNTLRFATFHKSEKPIGIQILGNDEAILREAARKLSELKPDVIDLNCGCPVNKVISNKMGAWLLNDTKKLGRLVKALVEGSNGIPVSVKLRLGMNPNKVTVVENAKVAEDNGAAFVTIHARSRKDKYDVEPAWEWIEKVKKNVSIPVIGNGSVFTPFDAVRMLEQTGCDSVMVARGALGNPFIFRDFNNLYEKNIQPPQPDIDEIKNLALRHIKMLADEYGNINSLDKAKKNIIWYFRMFGGITELLMKIFKAKTRIELEEIVINHSVLIKNNLHTGDDVDYFFKKFQNKVLFWLEEDERFTKFLNANVA